MKEVLEKYRDLTRKQIDLLKKHDIENSLQVVSEKQFLFSEIQKANNHSNEHLDTEGLENKTKLVEEIVYLNEQAVHLMSQERTRISNELYKIQQGRQTQKLYGSGYTVDPFFLDKNK